MSVHSRTDIKPLGHPVIAGPLHAAAALARVARLPLAVVVSLLPESPRRRWHTLPLAAGTFISAALQIALVGWWLVAEHDGYTRAAAAGAPALADGAHVAAFLLSTPVVFLAAYGALEGLLRLSSVVVLGEPLGTLPLWLAHGLLAGSSRLLGARDPHLCRDVAILRPDDTLEIRTCRARSWDAATTIEYRGTFYRIRDHLQTSDERRPYLYRLEPARTAHLIRRIHRYHPDELLQ